MNDNNGNDSARIDLEDIYVRSDDVVSRAIEEEFILVPITSGIGDLEDALYTLNETGREIWERLEPGKSVAALVDELFEEFEAPKQTITGDVIGILTELAKLRMVIKK